MRSPLVQVPEELAAAGVRLRPEQPADDLFLIALYRTTREAELEQAAHWTEEQKHGFVLMQFNAQRHHYQNALKNVSFDVIERHGEPIGRLYTQELETGLHIVDIVLMPELRGAGLGTAILKRLAADAAAAGKVLNIFVEFYNPAKHLYERLGFVQVGEPQGFVIEMEIPLSAAQAAIN